MAPHDIFSRWLNPNASQLGELDPLEVIAATPARLREWMDAIGGERAEQPRAPGQWSAREIACRLAECEVAFAKPRAAMIGTN